MKRMLLIGLVLVGIYIFWCYAHTESYCFFNPSIDTRYAPGFSDAAFNEIKAGMTAELVQRKIGAPLRIYDMQAVSGGLTLWMESAYGQIGRGCVAR